MLRPDAAPAIHLPEARGSRSQRRVTRIISPVLRSVLGITERSLVVVEAVRVAGWRRRLGLGSSWPFTDRVALVFTDRRLLEVALSAGARRATGDVREIVWNASTLPRTRGRTLRIGERSRWWLRHKVDAGVLAEIDTTAAAATTNPRRDGNAQEWRLCARCGATMPDHLGSCQRCGATRLSSRLAAFLTLAFPGAGMLYLGRRGYALLRCLTEVVLWLLFAERMLRADGLAMQAAAATVGAVVLILVKAEGVRMTRLLIDKAGAVDSETNDAAWRWRGAIGVVLSVAALALPVLLAGSLSTRITGDLTADAEDLGWRVSRQPSEWHQHEAGMRAEWRHGSGLVVRAVARPLDPFASARKTRLHWVEDHGQGPGVEAKRLDLENHRVLRVTETRRPPGEKARVILRYMVMDDYGRDEHALAASIHLADLESVEREIELLLPCLYWIPAHGEETFP